MLEKGRFRAPTTTELAPSPKDDEFTVFTSQLERGLGLPTSKFFRRFLAFCAIKSSDLGPHIIEQIAVFVAFCECYLGCEPYFPLWQHLFHGRMQKRDGVLRGNGGVTFQIRPKAKFFSLRLPSKASNEWRKYWFYARERDMGDGVAIPQYAAEPSTPRQMAVEEFSDEEAEVV